MVNLIILRTRKNENYRQDEALAMIISENYLEHIIEELQAIPTSAKMSKLVLKKLLKTTQ